MRKGVIISTRQNKGNRHFPEGIKEAALDISVRTDEQPGQIAEETEPGSKILNGKGMYLRTISVCVIAVSLFLAGCVGKAESTVDMNQPAIEGYDSVSYFALEKATKGLPQLAYVWKGAVWYFSSQDNLDRFKVEPEKYVPQFGSHCPVSLSKGGKAVGKPTNWKVIKDKLYFFATEDNLREFEKAPEEVLESAASHFSKD